MAKRQTVISVSVIDDGDFHYKPSVKKLKAGESVTWTCDQGPFAVSFKERTPFGRTNLHSTKAKDGKSWAINSVLPKNPERGHFHYAVAIYAGEKVYLDAGCPEVIIEE